MATALSIVLGLLAIAALVAWIMAIRLSYRIERLRNPSLPNPRLVYTNIFATAFGADEITSAEKPLQQKLRFRLFAALACLLVMASLSFALPLLPADKTATATPPGPPPVHAVGTTLTYIRSNQNGSKPEHILIHIPAPNTLHVAKMVAPCTDAAYVTATLDPATGEATTLIGGRLQKDATQLPQAFLTLDPARKLAVRIGDPAADPAEAPDAPPAPWRMYDFDLAELALAGPREPKSFTFGLALAWPDGPPPLVRILGQAEAKFLYSSESGARHHFTITGPAFNDPNLGDRGGELITDSRFGHVIQARFGRPNHSGYDNFLLKLASVAEGPGGEAAWRNAIAVHWKDCPADPR
ncbi:MAG: hypothetical protein IPO30_04560 [Hyphomonadaceae bacterium]|nr:hypothetical protein [Hyphomonadaceae bacterium]MBP9234241.1 hypothetical protein [Hyphomonadaceae bacterium]